MKMFLLGMLTMYLGTLIIALLVGSFTEMCEDTFLEYVFSFPLLIIMWIIKPIKSFIEFPKAYIFCFLHGINPWHCNYSIITIIKWLNYQKKINKNLLKHIQKNIRKKLKKYLTILRNDVIIIIEKEMLNMAKFTVLFRQDYEDEWEHLVLLDNKKNIVIDDTIENHKLSANDVLTLLEKYDIIKVIREEIEY